MTDKLRLFWRADAVLFLGRVHHADSHAHHAIQLLIACDDEPVEVEANGERVLGSALVIPSQVRHQVWASGELALLFIEPTSAMGSAAATRWGTAQVGRLCEQPWRDLARASLETTRAGQAAAVQALFRAAAPTSGAPQVVDPRVRTMLDTIRRRIDTPLAELSHMVALSPSRARRLFRTQVGMPIRSYRLWARLRAAVEQLAVSRSVTEAAHAAGFSDSAHLSRTFRRTLGVSPGPLRSLQGRELSHPVRKQ